MIQSLHLQNFRCFEHLELHGLRRINVLVGRNASGKTALLEALYLVAGGSPELALRIKVWRGLAPSLQISLDRRSYESLWKDLFFEFDQSRVVSIQVVGPPPSTRSLSISYGSEGVLTLPLENKDLDSALIVPIVFEWRDHKAQASRVEVSLTPVGLNMTPSGQTMPSAFFSSAIGAGNAAENAARFSELSKQKNERAIVDALRKEFPLVDSLSVEVSAGLPAIYASVAHLREKIPVGLLSGGINKLLSMLLAIAISPGGVILIDEIENGFFHDRLPQIWSALLTFCQLYDTQLIASTHSQECLAAIAPAVGRNEQEFCLIRADKRNGTCSAAVFAGRELQHALTEGMEVR